MRGGRRSRRRSLDARAVDCDDRRTALSIRPGAEEIAGDILGRVHSFLGQCSRRDWVPADLLEWLALFAAETRNETAAAMVQVLVDRSESVRFSVVYGDPSPEVLVSADGHLGLIDWGTPSWGPQLHDIAAWLRWLGERPGSRAKRELRFLASYNEHVDVTQADLDQLATYGRCAAAFRFGRPLDPRTAP